MFPRNFGFALHPSLERHKRQCLCLHNIRRWDKHIGLLLSDKNYLQFVSLLCFTEIYTKENNFILKISKILVTELGAIFTDILLMLLLYAATLIK